MDRGGKTHGTKTHRQQLQQGNVSDPPADRRDTVICKLAHPGSAFPLHTCPCSSSASFPTLAPAALPSLSCSLPLCVDVCACIQLYVYVCESACWNYDAAGSNRARFWSVRPHQLLSIFNQQVKFD